MDRLLAVAILLFASDCALGQELIRRIDGDHSNENFGQEVLSVGDIDGDLVSDFAASSLYGGARGTGIVEVFSGQTLDRLFYFEGEEENDQYGAALAVLDDASGGGLPELAVGAPRGGPFEEGYVHVIALEDGQLRHVFRGADPDENLGDSLARIGDLDSDSLREWAIGAPGGRSPGGAGTGFVRVLSGATGQVLFVYYGDDPGDRFGEAVAHAGDVNADGVPDVAVGAPHVDRFDPGQGAARVHSGLDGSVIWTSYGFGQFDEYGTAVTGIGDVDGDSFGDVVVGSPRDGVTGKVRAISGRDGFVIWSDEAGQTNQRYGTAVAFLGDLDSSTAGGVLVGGPQSSNGIVTLLDPVDGSEIRRWGLGASSRFGQSVSPAGDLEGDMGTDVLIGAPRDDESGNWSGSVYAYSVGGPQLFRAPARVAFDDFGRSLAGLDLTADGYSDLLIGAPLTFRQGVGDTGAVAIYSGRDGRDLAVMWGSTASELFGSQLVVLGDSGGDGISEFAVGSPGYDSVALGEQVGRVSVVDGATRSVILTIDGEAAGAEYGAVLAALSDINNDGHDEVVLGVPSQERAVIYSTADGAVLHDLSGLGSGFGTAVAAIPDLNADSIPDFAVGKRFGPGGPFVTVRSGDDASELLNLPGPIGSQFGSQVAHAGDINGDGIPDVAVGAPEDNPGGVSAAGSVFFHSGSDGVLLAQARGEEANGRFGAHLAFLGDVDGDGVGDTLIGSEDEELVAVFSGRPRRVTHTVPLPAGVELSIAVAGDVNSSGFPEFIVGSVAAQVSLSHARVFSLLDYREITLAEPDPGNAGASNVLNVWRGTPGARVYLAYSFEYGSYPVASCYGLSLDMESPIAVRSKTIDSNGEASFVGLMPHSFSGRILLLQLLEPSTCRKSNHVVYAVP